MELTIHNLSKTYGTKKALDTVNMTLTPGVYGLLGPNGAGKSTMMNIIAGNLIPDCGEILYNGQDIQAMGRNFRDILGFMPQQPGLYDSFTGFRFLTYIAALKGLDKKQASRAVAETSRYVNISDILHRKLGSYSGGMKQRIMIAQAILNDPQVLILDEPTAGLDPRERIRVRNMISEISTDKIVILATHVVSDIEYIGKEVIMLKKGRVIKQAAPHEILASLHGKVFEIDAAPSQIPEIEHLYLVSNLINGTGSITARIVSDTRPDGYTFREVRPTLEEEYLYSFAEEIVSCE